MRPLNSLIHKKRLQAYLSLIRFDKPVGTLLLLWPALWGLLLASSAWPAWQHLVIFTLGTFFMRSAGCAINDFADRKIDGKVARTAQRPLSQGAVQPFEALLITAVFLFLSLLLVLMLHPLTWLMACFGAIFACLYPFTKRWIASPQLVLGIAFAWAIPMGFAATQGTVPIIAWVYFALSVLWIIAYDTYYAMADRLDDQYLDIGSTALLFGQRAAAISFTLYLLFISGVMLLVARQFNDFIFTGLGWCGLSAFGLYQYHLANTGQSDLCIKAFKLNNITGLVVTLVLIIVRF